MQPTYAFSSYLFFISFHALQFHLKNKVPSSAASICVYSFTCSCAACYIGRTITHLSVKAREHHPAWLSSGVTKSIKSSVLAHLIVTGHIIDIKQSFQLIYRVKGNQSKLIRYRILAIAEAIGIRLFNPPLCAQKQFVQTLKLPWPSISSPPHYRLHKWQPWIVAEYLLCNFPLRNPLFWSFLLIWYLFVNLVNILYKCDVIRLMMNHWNEFVIYILSYDD